MHKHWCLMLGKFILFVISSLISEMREYFLKVIVESLIVNFKLNSSYVMKWVIHKIPQSSNWKNIVISNSLIIYSITYFIRLFDKWIVDYTLWFAILFVLLGAELYMYFGLMFIHVSPNSFHLGHSTQQLFKLMLNYQQQSQMTFTWG